MTLGIFTDDFYPYIGGIGRYLYEISNRLPSDQIIVFSPCKNNIDHHVQIKPCLHDSLMNLSFSMWMHRHIEKIIEKYNISKINIQCGPGGLFLLKKIGIPVIATCHHTWWQQSSYIRQQSWKKIFIPLEKRTYELADKIICVSDSSLQTLQTYYSIPAYKMTTIPNGVNTRRFYPITSIKKIKKSILFVGRIEQRKGLDFLIRSMIDIIKILPDAKLFIGGRGKQTKELKTIIKNNNLGKNIKFLGFIPDNRLNLLYNKVECVVVPSIFEGFGLTVIEAMAAGTPVVATRAASIEYIINDDIDGSLVDYGDTEALSHTIIHLLQDINKRKALAEEAYKKVINQFNWDLIIKQYMTQLLGPIR